MTAQMPTQVYISSTDNTVTIEAILQTMNRYRKNMGIFLSSHRHTLTTRRKTTTGGMLLIPEIMVTQKHVILKTLTPTVTFHALH